MIAVCSTSPIRHRDSLMGGRFCRAEVDGLAFRLNVVDA